MHLAPLVHMLPSCIKLSTTDEHEVHSRPDMSGRGGRNGLASDGVGRAAVVVASLQQWWLPVINQSGCGVPW